MVKAEDLHVSNDTLKAMRLLASSLGVSLLTVNAMMVIAKDSIKNDQNMREEFGKRISSEIMTLPVPELA